MNKEFQNPISTDSAALTENGARLNVLYEIGRILASLETMNEAAPQILEAIGRHLQFEFGELWCMGEKDKILRLENFWHLPSPQLEEFAAASRRLEFTEGDGLPGKVWAINAPVWIENIGGENDFPRNFFGGKTDLQSGFAFPIILDEKVHGVFSFFSRAARPPDAGWLPMFAVIGNNIGQFIKRERIERNLRESEERYRAFIEQSTEGIWRFEFDEKFSVSLPIAEQIEMAFRHGYLAECNDAMAAMYNLTKAEDLVGSRISDLLDMNDAANIEYLRAVIESGYNLTDAESHEKDANGGDKYFLNSLVGTIENGHLARLWGTQRDITEQKRAERASRESEENFRAFVQASSQAIWTTDSEQNLEAFGWWENQTGQKRGESAGAGFLDAIHPQDRERVTDFWQIAIKTIKSFKTECRISNGNGEYQHFELRGVPVFNTDDSFRQWLGTLTDITDRKLAEQSLKDSEERYRALVEATSTVVWRATTEGELSFVGSFWETVSGQRVEEILGSGWLNALHPDDRARTIEVWQQSLINKNIYETEFRVLTIGGEYRWFAVRGIPVLDGEGNVREWIGANTDIHERKIAEAKLRESQEVLSLAMQSSRMGAWSRNMLTEIVYWSAELEEIFGLETGTFSGSLNGFYDYVYAADQEPLRLEVQKALTERRDYIVEFRFHHADGSLRWMEGRGQAVYTDDGTPAKAYGIGIDITGRKSAESERERLLVSERQARAVAEEANHAKDEFIALVSHELRSPLNAMLGWTRILQHQSPDAKTIEYALDVIVRNARSQSRLIEDLLDIARVGKGKLRVEMEPTELIPIINAAVEIIKPAAEAKNINFSQKLERTADFITGDVDRLRQVVENLLANAVKFTPSGGSVEIRLERLDKNAQITVSDNGQGISAEFLPQIFERFKQADPSATRRHGGLGIGLSLARDLVELHGGTISAQSAGEGKGSILTVTLPLRKIAPINENSDKGEFMDAHGKLSGFWILAVDDEADARELISFMLQINGAKVTTANSAVEVLELLKSTNGRLPDILLSDISMPNESGYALLEKIRALPLEHGGQIPAVALTAFNRPEDREAAFEAGFQKHLGKPVEPEDLISAIIETVGARSVISDK
ncbi:MAG: PAS domain S-box protein [Pyrinomonadaceae bacterium]|nr:PAS domain S-box protein [Pyrinomonadaceae bacterium]